MMLWATNLFDEHIHDVSAPLIYPGKIRDLRLFVFGKEGALGGLVFNGVVF
jgi:hypothetical protein